MTVDALVRDLRPIVRAGLERASAPTAGHLAVIVDRHAEHAGYEPTDDGRAAALRDLIRDAINSLGDGPPADAARALFGDSAGTRYRSLVERRGIAAETLDIADSTFRRRYQRRMLRDLAQHLYSTRHRAPPDPTTTEPDTATVRSSERDHDDTTATVIALFDDEETGERENLRVIAVPAPTRREQLGQLVGGLRSRYRYDRYILVPLALGVVWYRWGRTAALRFAAVLLVVGLVVVTAEIVRNRSLATASTAQTIYQRVPRLLILALIGVLVIDLLDFGQDTAQDRIPRTSEPSTTTTSTIPDAPRSYPPPGEPVAPTCPAPDDEARRLAFTDPPPLCINPDRAYIARIHTNHGYVDVTLNTQGAALTVNNFVFLARWNYYDGVGLHPYYFASSPTTAETLLSEKAVAREDAQEAPGYTLVFDTTTDYPPNDNVIYLTMATAFHPDQFMFVITPHAHDYVSGYHQQAPDEHGAFPLLGQVTACRDIIAQQDGRGGYLPRTFDAAPLVIEDITITEHDPSSITYPRPDLDDHCREEQAGIPDQADDLNPGDDDD